MRRVILVVDPNETDAAGTQRQLKAVDTSAEVLIARTGDAALALLAERRLAPSLILLEYDLGGRTGLEVLSEIRSQRWLERVPIVMFTDPIADRIVVNCYRLGAAAFLTKPVSTFDVRETVRDFAIEARQHATATVVPALAQAQVQAA